MVRYVENNEVFAVQIYSRRNVGARSRSFSEIRLDCCRTVTNGSVSQDIIFGEKVCAFLKSNAIAIVYKGQTIGLGMVS